MTRRSSALLSVPRIAREETPERNASASTLQLSLVRALAQCAGRKPGGNCSISHSTAPIAVAGGWQNAIFYALELGVF